MRLDRVCSGDEGPLPLPLAGEGWGGGVFAKTRWSSGLAFPHPPRSDAQLRYRARRPPPQAGEVRQARRGPGSIKSHRNLFLVRLLAADGLELGEDRIDVEVVALFLRRLVLRLLAGGFGGRQQRRAAVADVGRLLLGRALHLEVEFDLRAEAKRHR